MAHKIPVQKLIASSGVRFGTSDACGLVADMSGEVCFAYTAALLDAIDVKNRAVAVAKGMILCIIAYCECLLGVCRPLDALLYVLGFREKP